MCPRQTSTVSLTSDAARGSGRSSLVSLAFLDDVRSGRPTYPFAADEHPESEVIGVDLAPVQPNVYAS